MVKDRRLDQVESVFLSAATPLDGQRIRVDRRGKGGQRIGQVFLCVQVNTLEFFADVVDKSRSLIPPCSLVDLCLASATEPRSCYS